MNIEEEKALIVELIEGNLPRCPPGYLLGMADGSECIPQVLELEGAAYLIPYNNLLTEIKRLILIDDKDQFACFLEANQELLQNYPPHEVLHLLSLRGAVGCLTALLESRLRVDIDINSLCSGMSPLHHAACHLSYAMTHLLLQHGADIEPATDADRTPLRTALDLFHQHKFRFEDWTTEKSILKLLYFYCLPKSKEPLDVIRLLASHTKKLDALCLELMNRGLVEHYAALLMVAWDKTMVSSPNRGLVNTPVWSYITRVLNNASLQQEICSTYLLSKEKLVTNLNIALGVVKTVWRTIGVLESYYHPSIESFYDPNAETFKMKELPFHVTYELAKNARLDLKPDGAGANLLCFLPKLTSETKVLPEQKYSMEPQQFGSILRSFVGKPVTSSSETPPLSLMSRYQYRKLYILSPMEKHRCKIAQVKPSSHNVLAPLMWFARRSGK